MGKWNIQKTTGTSGMRWASRITWCRPFPANMKLFKPVGQHTRTGVGWVWWQITISSSGQVTYNSRTCSQPELQHTPSIQSKSGILYFERSSSVFTCNRNQRRVQVSQRGRVACRNFDGYRIGASFFPWIPSATHLHLPPPPFSVSHLRRRNRDLLVQVL